MAELSARHSLFDIGCHRSIQSPGRAPEGFSDRLRCGNPPSVGGPDLALMPDQEEDTPTIGANRGIDLATALTLVMPLSH